MKKEIMKFGAPWCAPCKRLDQELKGLQIEVTEINVDDNPAAAAQFGISGLPTVLLMEDGKVIKRLHGATDAVIATIKDFVS